MKITKSQKATLNKLLREILLKRDKVCLRCGAAERLQAAHIYPKGLNRKMEYDDKNLLLLCWRCHMHFFHKHPIAAHEWLESILTRQRLDYLKLRANTVDKSVFDYQLEKLYLESQLKKYEKKIQERQ